MTVFNVPIYNILLTTFRQCQINKSICYLIVRQKVQFCPKEIVDIYQRRVIIWIQPKTIDIVVSVFRKRFRTQQDVMRSAFYSMALCCVEEIKKGRDEDERFLHQDERQRNALFRFIRGNDGLF